MTTPAKRDPKRPISEYGCVFCDRRHLPRWHREGLDAEYEPHIGFQSKHGIHERMPTVGEVFERLMKDDE